MVSKLVWEVRVLLGAPERSETVKVTDRLIVKEIERLQGGRVVAAGGKVLASLALPIAGLLSDKPLEVVVSKLEELERLARDLGTTLPSPFPTLSFLALPVLPELRLTDLGLVDVNEFRLVRSSRRPLA